MVLWGLCYCAIHVTLAQDANNMPQTTSLPLVVSCMLGTISSGHSQLKPSIAKATQAKIVRGREGRAQ